MPPPTLLRRRADGTRVSNTELFFDLVYVVAVTQLSTFLRGNPTWHGAAQAAVLLGMVWNIWVYTTWVTNWLDPEKTPTQVMLLTVMAGSMVLAAGVSDAYGGRGLWVGVTYAAMQVGRSAYTVWATRTDPSLRRNYLRILSWCALSGSLAVLGGVAHGNGRLALFAGAVLIDVIGGLAQFWVPGLGRTDTREWTIDGPHFAERCQAFVLIALGESLVGVGAPLIDAGHVTVASVAGLIGAFVAVATMFLIYFDRWAARGVETIGHSNDPGRLAARAFHLVHPVMIGGIIMIAAGNEEVLSPLLSHDVEHETLVGIIAWFCAGGAALFIAGHTLYLRLISGKTSAPHLTTAMLLTGVAIISPVLHPNALEVGLATGTVLLALFVSLSRMDHEGSRRANRVVR